jgi:hypothetical protein
MKLILTVFVVCVLLAGVVASASAADVLDLSTIGKSTSQNVTALPKVSPNMPTIAPTALGGQTEKSVLDLSTLGKKAESNVAATLIKGASAITVTPMFAVKNANASNVAGSIVTLPVAVAANATVYTPPIAIFGGA